MLRFSPSVGLVVNTMVENMSFHRWVDTDTQVYFSVLR